EVKRLAIASGACRWRIDIDAIQVRPFCARKAAIVLAVHRRGIEPGLAGIARGFQVGFDTPAIAFGDDVAGFDGADVHRPAHAALDAPAQRRAFLPFDAAKQRRVEIAAVARPAEVQPDVGGLLGAVDGQRRAPLAGDAANIRGDGLAAARVHAVDAVHALEHVAGVGHLEALQFLAALVDAGDVLLIDLVMPLGVLVLPADDRGRGQFELVIPGDFFLSRLRLLHGVRRLYQR